MRLAGIKGGLLEGRRVSDPQQLFAHFSFVDQLLFSDSLKITKMQFTAVFARLYVALFSLAALGTLLLHSF